jgi:hypothetical protein
VACTGAISSRAGYFLEVFPPCRVVSRRIQGKSLNQKTTNRSYAWTHLIFLLSPDLSALLAPRVDVILLIRLSLRLYPPRPRFSARISRLRRLVIYRVLRRGSMSVLCLTTYLHLQWLALCLLICFATSGPFAAAWSQPAFGRNRSGSP